MGKITFNETAVVIEKSNATNGRYFLQNKIASEQTV